MVSPRAFEFNNNFRWNFKIKFPQAGYSGDDLVVCLLFCLVSWRLAQHSFFLSRLFYLILFYRVTTVTLKIQWRFQEMSNP